MKRWPLLFLLISLCLQLRAQDLDILIKGAYLIDAKNGIRDSMDVGVLAGKIARVAPQIASEDAKKVIDASGLILSPGLIDLHTHLFVGSQARTFADGFSSVSPDDFSFRSGITTMVDAGTSGWRNFETFKKNVIDASQTRVLAFLNIAGTGMSGNPEQENLLDMDPEKAFETLLQYPDILVGIKIGHYTGPEWTPFENALQATEMANKPLLVECHLPQYTLAQQLEKMRPGDILTHSFEEIEERMPIVDEQGMLRSFVRAAYDRGILFDVGHGGAGFWFSQAIPAVRQGLTPHSFGTDLHRFSMNSGMKNMLNVMSKFINIGMEVNDVIERASWQAAQAIKRTDLGHLSEGAVADLTLLKLHEGEFGFIDAGGNKIEGKYKLETELTMKGGKIVYDLNGLAAKKYTY
ncbi:amidohydrolase/deacetylase family metallohydrolase [Cyclobacterium sp.]|uniref:amidohydrolase/deacetylase family metallohydrolase n=1 Tax=Cyclobacterium sp. TaxID=1966343 RepID=UPI0019B5EF91|nr:amidohydrolase/deacetylase family metallohydrolase [Cyclobacterium sp.]MBD3626520.1 amidohydrolase/deacetylase family metallohydrolase [Cyclobacterium sp.]